MLYCKKLVSNAIHLMTVAIHFPASAKNITSGKMTGNGCLVILSEAILPIGYTVIEKSTTFGKKLRKLRFVTNVLLTVSFIAVLFEKIQDC